MVLSANSSASSPLPMPPPPPPEAQAWYEGASNYDKSCTNDDPAVLRAHLFDLGLEEYVQILAERGIATPRQLEALTTAQIEALLPEKPVHARRLAAHGSLRRGVDESPRDVGSFSPALRGDPQALTTQRGTVYRGRLAARKQSLRDAEKAANADELPQASSSDHTFAGPWNNELIIDSFEGGPNGKLNDIRTCEEVGTEVSGANSELSETILNNATIDVEHSHFRVTSEVIRGSPSTALDEAEDGGGIDSKSKGYTKTMLPRNIDGAMNAAFSLESQKMDERTTELLALRIAAAEKYMELPAAARQEAQIAAMLSAVAALSASLHKAEVTAEAAHNYERSRHQAATTRTFVPWVTATQCALLLREMSGAVCMGERAAMAVALCACLDPEEAEDEAEAFFKRRRRAAAFSAHQLRSNSNSASVSRSKGRRRSRGVGLDHSKVSAAFVESPRAREGHVDDPSMVIYSDFWNALDCSQLPALEEAIADLLNVHGSKAAAERNWRQITQSCTETELQLRFLGANFYSEPMLTNSSLHAMKKTVKTAPSKLIRQASMLSMRGTSIRYQADPGRIDQNNSSSLTSSLDGGSMDYGKFSLKVCNYVHKKAHHVMCAYLRQLCSLLLALSLRHTKSIYSQLFVPQRIGFFLKTFFVYSFLSAERNWIRCGRKMH